MRPPFEIPGHWVVRTLRQGPDLERTVLLTERKGDPCVTRIWHSAVPRELLATLQDVAVGLPPPPGSLPADLAADFEGYRVRVFLRELPFIPEVVEIGLLAPDEERSFPYITTRWVEGETLAQTMRRRDFDVAERQRMLKQVLAILADLHRRNVLHGDLKPENLVVGHEGEIHLIDLDTLRHVDGPTAYATVSQVTWSRVWPECTRHRPDGQREYIASLPSDLWSYGLLVSELLAGKLPGNRGFPPELPPPWGAVLKACLRANPATRPNTEELIKAVEGLPADLGSWVGETVNDDQTVRVPDRKPGRHPRPAVVDRGTERVVDTAVIEPEPEPLQPKEPVETETEEPTPQRPTPAPPPAKRGLRWLRWPALGLASILILLMVGAMLEESEPVSGEVTALRHRLKQHKSIRELNDLRQARQLAVEAGKIALGPDGGAEAWGLYALLGVWSQGWHFGGARELDMQNLELHHARAGYALRRGVTSEALLARAIAAGAACRLLDRDAAGRLAYCEEARQRTEQLSRRNLEGWLAVEVLWNAGMLERSEFLRALARQDTEASQGFARADMGYCDDAEPVVNEAPINGAELAEHCVAAALAVGDVDKWLWWVERLFALSPHDQDKIARHVFRNAHPSCRGLPATLPSPSGNDPGLREYCWFQTLTALRCPDRARDLICGGSGPCRLPSPTEVPWNLAQLARDRAPGGECLLDERSYVMRAIQR